MQNQTKRKITFNTQLKNALNANSKISKNRQWISLSRSEEAELSKAPFRLGARSRLSGTGTSLNRAFCRCPSKNLGTVPGHGH